MKKARPISPVLPLAVAMLLWPVSAAPAADWLQWGGPNGDFTVESEGLADGWPKDGPTTLWKRPLGGGYSSILVHGDRLFTMYREGDEEVVAALEAATGKTVWAHRYTPSFWPDMTHAFGLGPNATPAILGDRIFSISIDGQLKCLDLASGELLWQHDLPKEYGRRSRDEEYGYSQSPLIYRGTLLVQVGGTDHGVVAFDPADGKPLWKSDPGGVSYAQATVANLGGQDQFIYFSPQGVLALDPKTGARLWDSPIEYSNGNHLTPIVQCDDSHIWVGSQFPTGGGRLLEVKQVDGTWTAEQVWFETYLRAAHWTNIRLGDFIYGSIGGNQISILTAFNWKTGDIAWRRRGFHKAQALYADGKFLFLDEEGKLVLSKVSPTGLEVLASVPVTESVSWTLPTLAGTTLYLRDQTHILAMDLAETGGERQKVEAAEPAFPDSALQGEFGEFVRKISAANDKKPLIDAFIEEQKSFPIVEDGSLVHFIFRGNVPDVAISGNFLARGSMEPLHQVPGTDLYFRSLRLPAKSHFEYSFRIFDDQLADPLNPRVSEADDDASILTTVGWIEPLHLREPDGARGRLETFEWASKVLENEREIKVYLPAGYEGGDDRYPLVMVNYGDEALEQGRWAHSLDNLIGESVAPLIAVFIPRVNFNEYGPAVEQFTDAIASELLPTVDKRYRILSGPENRAMTGIASGAFASSYLALGRPDLVGKVAAQSFYFRSEAEEKLKALIEKGGDGAPSFYVEWSLHDVVIAQAGVFSEKHSREFAERLNKNSFPTVTHEVTDGAGWGSWRARTDRILEHLFPLSD
ncbi:MAG: PQQ-binding-like beta-propeller repeat protein [Acidobacteriota bacterium]